MMLLKKTAYDKLVAKVKNVYTSGFFKKAKYTARKLDFKKN